MRYLYVIAAVIVLMSLGVFIVGHKSVKETTPPLLRINDKTISQNEYDEEKARNLRYVANEEEFLDNLVTRELLIQYGKQQGLDREESFRNAIQEYYEQTLIRLLLERKFSAFKPEVGDEEINWVITHYGKKIVLAIFRAKSEAELVKQPAEILEAEVADLSQSVFMSILLLPPGEMSAVKKEGQEVVAYRVEAYKDADQHAPAAKQLTREEARSWLADYKKQQAVNVWITSLRDEARVEVRMPQQEAE